eukprot:TRINITY_DN18373_c0_g1_i1.p1 TRINITY_DN18373_c0_g1~~TRINITY_DN18373_c0_g1_i1.p1  ORF type:complete len:372 (+),score=19.16 TRINITY_DN18373_c0_g1_i1:419-1534(+)
MADLHVILLLALVSSGLSCDTDADCLPDEGPCQDGSCCGWALGACEAARDNQGLECGSVPNNCGGYIDCESTLGIRGCRFPWGEEECIDNKCVACQNECRGVCETLYNPCWGFYECHCDCAGPCKCDEVCDTSTGECVVPYYAPDGTAACRNSSDDGERQCVTCATYGAQCGSVNVAATFGPSYACTPAVMGCGTCQPGQQCINNACVTSTSSRLPTTAAALTTSRSAATSATPPAVTSTTDSVRCLHTLRGSWQEVELPEPYRDLPELFFATVQYSFARNDCPNKHLLATYQAPPCVQNLFVYLGCTGYVYPQGSGRFLVSMQATPGCNMTVVFMRGSLAPSAVSVQRAIEVRNEYGESGVYSVLLPMCT